MTSAGTSPSSPPDAPASAPHPARWKALIAAWLGWCFDGLDGYLYVIVAVPFVTQLLENQYGPGNIPPGQVAAKAALIQCVFLVGWAVGGAVFGRIAGSHAAAA